MPPSALLLAPFLSIVLAAADYLPTSTYHAVVRREQYTVSYSEPHEQAEWVFYEFTAEEARRYRKRTNSFRRDPRITSGSAELSDYRGSGFDRGPLPPAPANTASDQVMRQSFYLSNVSPQRPAFNRGIWRSLEYLVRGWAVRRQRIYVVTGPVFSRNPQRIGVNRVTVPAHFYKIVYDPNTTPPHMIGFILPNQRCRRPPRQYAVPVDRIEKRTGIDFFPGLPDRLEKRLEAGCRPEKWSWKVKRIQRQGKKAAAEKKYRCAAYTKDGTRCKRRGRGKGGRCWQHRRQKSGKRKNP